MRLHLVVLALAVGTASPLALANGGCSDNTYSTGGRGKSVGIQRDAHGHIKRSKHAKDEFKASHPCPSTGKSSGACPGYVIDHVIPLKGGGADAPSNMQWQTEADAKAKDRWE